jgi:hypothetical protein
MESQMPMPNQPIKTIKPTIDIASIKPLMQEANISSLKLSYDKLEGMLRKFREYPAKYRKLIWRFILNLPLNKEAFQNILAKGVHPAFANLKEEYPIKPLSLYNKLLRMLSALAYWSPAFAQIQYLPQLIFPFTKILEYDDMISFEVIMSVIMQWCSSWFSSYPLPPENYLKIINDTLVADDPSTLQAIMSKGFRISDIAWPILCNFFTNIMNEKDWLVMMDHVITYYHRPLLLPCICAAYIKYFKNTISKMLDINQLSIFLHQFNPMNLMKILDDAMAMLPISEKMCQFTADRIPLPKEQYPLFTDYRPTMLLNGASMKDILIAQSNDGLREQEAKQDMQTKKRDLAKKILLLLNGS